MYTLKLDDEDRKIIAAAARNREQMNGVRVGDYVEYADGVLHRIIEVWGDMIQTTATGSFHLSDSGHVSASGACWLPVPVASLTDTGLRSPGEIWIFHHGLSGADRGVSDKIDCRVFRCAVPCPPC